MLTMCRGGREGNTLWRMLTYADVCLRVLTKGGQYSPLDRRLVWACVQTRGKVCLKGVRNWTQTDRYGTSQQYMRCWSELVWPWPPRYIWYPSIPHPVIRLYRYRYGPSRQYGKVYVSGCKPAILAVSCSSCQVLGVLVKVYVSGCKPVKVYVSGCKPAKPADMKTRTPRIWQEPTRVIQAIIQGSTQMSR